MDVSSKVRAQYQNHPYPPIPWFALPSGADQEKLEKISFERATRLAFGKARLAGPKGEKGIRILVVGAGTFEPLVVALANPGAAEIVAIDLSRASLFRLKCRWWLSRVMRWYRRHPRLRCVAGDFQTWDGEAFDFIFASNVLHHLENPAEGLKKLAALLKDDGVMRVVTYPKMSRVWLREASRWLKAQGLSTETPDLVRVAREKIMSIPTHDSPEVTPKGIAIRSAFLSQSEVGTKTGLIDAFFHACENPLHPMEWAKAAHGAGLRLVAEDQDPASQSEYLDQIFPEVKDIHRWLKLQALDDLLEVCANFIFWFRKGDPKSDEIHVDFFHKEIPASPNMVFDEIREALRRVDLIVALGGLSSDQIRRRLLEKLVSQTYPGLSLADLPGRDLVEEGLVIPSN